MSELTRSAAGPRTRIASVRVADLAERQSGAISRAQLMDCGLTDGSIARAVAGARLHRIHPAVYAVGLRDLAPRGRMIAALLYGGHGSALSGRAGLWWLDLLPGPPSVIDLCAPARKRSLQEIRTHHPRRSFERIFHRGLPVLPLGDLLVGAATDLSAENLRRVLAEADYRRLLDLSALRDAMQRGRTGSSAVRVALDAHLPELARTESELEARFLLLCERGGLPMPEVNRPLGRYRPDMLWRSARLIVELDGAAAHTSPARMDRDRARELHLRALGFDVLRYTWAQIRFEAEAVRADLRRRLDRNLEIAN